MSFKCMNSKHHGCNWSTWNLSKLPVLWACYIVYKYSIFVEMSTSHQINLVLFTINTNIYILNCGFHTLVRWWQWLDDQSGGSVLVSVTCHDTSGHHQEPVNTSQAIHLPSQSWLNIERSDNTGFHPAGEMRHYQCSDVLICYCVMISDEAPSQV